MSTEARPDRLSVLRPGHRLNGITYIAAYCLGVAGFVLDALGHRNSLPSENLGHILMAIAGLIALALLSAPWDESRGAKVALAGLAIGVIALSRTSLLGAAILMVVPRAILLHRERPVEGPGVFLVIGGLVLLLLGGVVDTVWHLQEPSPPSHEAEDILVLPGHLIQLAGWVVGLLGALLVVRWTRRGITSR